MTREESIKAYYFRVNKCIDYIKDNLDRDLTLEKLASVSNFSKFHFHRIFKSVTGSTINDFIIKARIERALFFLMHHPEKTMAEISILTGFSSLSAFSRTFRETMNLSPGEWKNNFKKSKIRIMQSNTLQQQVSVKEYLASKLNAFNMNHEITLDFEVKELEEMNVAYVRDLDIHKHDSEKFGKMFALLLSWATPRNLINFPQTKALTVYRSNANLSGHLQADACITVPENTEGEGLIGITKISGGLYTIFHKEAPMSSCMDTWNSIYTYWFEQNGYQPDNRNFFLSHLNDPTTHPQGFHIVDIYIPVKPL